MSIDNDHRLFDIIELTENLVQFGFGIELRFTLQIPFLPLVFVDLYYVVLPRGRRATNEVSFAYSYADVRHILCP